MFKPVGRGVAGPQQPHEQQEVHRRPPDLYIPPDPRAFP